MIDYCQEEIGAIKSVFPTSKIQLCDFHCEQAWERWVRRKEHEVESRDQALSLMRHLAHATCAEEFEAFCKSLRESVFWQNHRFQEYMLTHWIHVSDMWVKFYRQRFAVALTTNNGTESQNKLLKEFYLQGGHERRSLTGLITVLVTVFP